MSGNSKEWEIINIVILGRGGQGAVTAAEIVAEAAYLSGNFVDVHAYPSFGAERRGAPIQSYAKLSKKEKLWDRSQIENPHIIIALDLTVLNPAILSSMKQDGILLIDSEKEPSIFRKQYNLQKNIKIYAADISKMALEKNLILDGAPIVNIGILGLLSKAISQIDLKNIEDIVNKRMDEAIAKKNISLMGDVFQSAKTS